MLTPESRIADFPYLEKVHYLNTAADGLSPSCMKDALVEYAQDKAKGMGARENHYAKWHALRKHAGVLFSVPDTHVALCSSSSEAFNLIATSLHLQAGDEIIVNDLDYPSGISPWHRDDTGIKVSIWHSRNGQLHSEDLQALLTENTKLVNLSLVSFYNGFRVDLEEISAIIRKSSAAALTLDATQAAGRILFDTELVDIVVSSTHKWLIGSHGACIIAIPKTSKVDWHVQAGGWHNLENPFNSNRFEQAAKVMPGADGFMLGMPSFPAVYAVERSLAYLLGIGVHNIERAANPLVKYAIEELTKLPVNVITPNIDKHLAGILAFTHPNAEKICQFIIEKNVSVIYHAGRIRLAIHGYNNEQDIEAFLTHLKAALTQ